MPWNILDTQKGIKCTIPNTLVPTQLREPHDVVTAPCAPFLSWSSALSRETRLSGSASVDYCLSGRLSQLEGSPEAGPPPATVSPEHHDSEPGPTPLHSVRHWPSVFPEPAPPGNQQHCYVAAQAVRLELILRPSTSTLLIHHPFVSLRYLASSLSNLSLLRVHTTVVFLFPDKWCLHLPVMTLYEHMLSTPAPLDMDVGTGACSGQGGEVESITYEHQPWAPRRFSCTPVPLPFSHSGPRSCPTSWVLEWQWRGSWAAADPRWPQSPARHTGKNKATPKLTIHTAPAWKHKVLLCLAMWETWVWFLGWEDPLEKLKATHSSILAWRIPWTV